MKEKLIFVYFWGDIACSGTSFVPFEYEGANGMSAKDKFVYDVLEKFKDYPWTYYSTDKTHSDYDTDKVEVFEECYLSKGDLSDLEHNVKTLEEWFEERKEKKIFKD